MSGYSGRSGVNVSQYLANLNTIPSPQDTDTPVDPPSRDEDFSLFMNPDFFDQFNEAGPGNVDLSAPLPGFDLDANSQAGPADRVNSGSNGASEPKMDFNLSGDFQFADFSNFPNSIVDPSISTLSHPQSSTFPGGAPTFTSPVSAVSPVTPGFDQPIDETARVAAEEDKRRRNTAASARFRIKKKQREQALEKTAKEMSDRVSLLESRISQLETENTWLKGLITEKSGGKTSTSEIRALLSKHEENSERSTGNRTDGVGTKPEGSKA